MKTGNKKALRILMAFTLNSITILALSQDTLHFRNGSSIISKVLEISPLEIKYKKIENTDGPVYIVNKEEVKFIRYKNGSIDSFTEIKPWFKSMQKNEKQEPNYVIPKATKQPKIVKEGRSYFWDNTLYNESKILAVMKHANNPEINMHIRKSKLAKAFQPICIIGIPAVAVGAVAVVSSGGIYNSPKNAKKIENFGFSLLAFSAVCLTTSITLENYRHKHNEIALRLYNQNN